MPRMDKSAQNLLLPIFFIVFWLSFAYIWLVIGWKDTNKLFTPHWWFDEVGHALFGTMGSCTLLFLFQNYAAKGVFRITGRFFLALVIIAIISLLGVLWELVEFIWDMWLQPEHFDWLGKAQSDSIDTMIDILVNASFSTLVMGIYGIYNMLYTKIYPDESALFQIEELTGEIKAISHAIGQHRREHLRHIVPALRELIHTARERRKQKPLL